jgi:hypothetical protein
MSKTREQVWARLGDEQVRQLNIRCAELGIKRPEGVARAISE